MWLFDVETLGKRSNSVILSFACIQFDATSKPSPDQLREDAFFVKFDVEEQVKKYKREVKKPTLEWWSKQCDNVKNKSFRPDKTIDEEFIPGYERFREWVKSKNDKDSWVWARGNLDQLVLDDIEEQLELKPIFYYNRWRDVRTAIDIFYDNKTGYVDVDYPGFDPSLHITKHNPIDDCLYDVMMLIYGKSNSPVS